jgi:rfaE bifunctional protein nucleotidyltransferase chain/domain
MLSLRELASERDRLHRTGGRLVLTNGCFDLLHLGHVRYLQAARALGDALAVAVNGDDSVRALKGPTRPLNSEQDRAEVLAALECVDFVVVFPEVRATEVIRQVRPHLYAKGGDYTRASLDREEIAALETAGTSVHILPLVPGKSTTRLIEQVQTGDC